MNVNEFIKKLFERAAAVGRVDGPGDGLPVAALGLVGELRHVWPRMLPESSLEGNRG